jgi:hypothetical protein
MHRELCLCDDNNATLHQIDPGIKARGFSFTAYVSWRGFRVHEDVLELADASPEIGDVVAEARSVMRRHVSDRRAEEHTSKIQAWREEDVYPFSDNETLDPIEQATQTFFNYVAVTASDAVNSTSDPVAKRLSMEAIKLAIESNPSSFERIIREVLNLPADKVQEFHDLLGKTTLPALISASKMITARLDLLRGLDHVLFDQQIRKVFLERAHLHKIIENAPWIFGEEYATHVSDQSLTSLLKAHLKELGRTDSIDSAAVVDADGNDRRVDFMFGRALELNQNKREHLIVEIKKSASNNSSRTILTACCATRSRTVGIPNGRIRPSGLGISTRRTGDGRYVPARRSAASSSSIR